jgi:hypothetical protein
MHFKIQDCPLVREGTLHEEISTCQTEENVKSANWLEKAARHRD